MASPQRISAQEVRRKQSSNGLLLVCGYDSEDKFQQNHLDGAISLNILRAREKSIPKNEEIVFYCA
jgi:rhodanese-related sulfurtransferase